MLNSLSLIRWPGGSGGSGTGGTAVQADNGLSVLAGLVVLGQNVGQVGSPAKLLSPREIPFNGQSVLWNNIGSVAGSHMIFRQDTNAHITLDPYIEFQSSASGELARLRVDNSGGIYFGVVSGVSSTGSGNIGFGAGTLNANTTGHDNISIGGLSMFTTTTTNKTVAIGSDLLNGVASAGDFNVCIGHNSFNDGSQSIGTANISIGSAGGGVVGDHCVLIGHGNFIFGTATNTTILAHDFSTALSNVAILTTNTQNALIGAASGTATDSGDRLQVYGTMLLDVLPTTSNQTTYVAWDKVTHRLVAGASGTTVLISADNGLTANTPTANNVELGGKLIKNTTVDTQSSFTLSLSGEGTNTVLNAFSTSSGLAAQLQSTSGIGAVISTNTGAYGASIGASPATTNSAQKVLNVLRTTTGTAAAGMGGFIGYELNDAGNFTQEAGALSFEWTDSSHTNFTSLFRLRGATLGNAIADWMTVNASGIVGFGSGTGITCQSGLSGAFLQGTAAGAVMMSNAIPAQAANNSTSPNTVTTTFLSSRQGSNYIGAAGSGTQIAFDSKNNAGAIQTSGYIQNILTNAGSGSTFVAQFVFTLPNSGSLTNVLTLDGNGNMTTISGHIDHIATTSAANYTIAATDFTVIFTGTTTTATFAVLIIGQRYNLVNHGTGAVTLGTAVTTANGTTTTTLPAGSSFQVQYDGTVLRKIN